MSSLFSLSKPTLYVGTLVAAAGVLAGGIALKPAIAQILPNALVTCSSGSPCQTYKNTGVGAGLEGLTGKGIGLEGSATKAGTGVEALSVFGIGLMATAGSIAVEGLSTSGYGGYFSGSENVTTGSTAGLVTVGPIALSALSTSTGDVVQAFGGGGLLFRGVSSASLTVFDVDNGGDIFGSGVVSGLVLNGCCTSDRGVFGEGAFAGVEGHAGSDGSFGFYADGFGGDLFVGNNSSAVDSFIVDNSGNIFITGNIFTAGICSSGCAVTQHSAGPRVVSYSPHESQPTMEDFGEGQLTDGRGYVSLETKFATTIDQHANYMVFITPEGDSKGVYVTQKSPTGFAVRENQGGRSTLAFSYRIVAKPFGDNSARLPTITPRTVSAQQKNKRLVRPTFGKFARPSMPAIPHT